MGIESNDAAPTPKEPTPNAGSTNTGSGFVGADLGSRTPTGGFDFLSLRNRLQTNRIDSAVEPYLTEVKNLVTANMSNVELVSMQRVQGAYAFKYAGPDGLLTFFVIQFVSTGDPVLPNMVPASARLRYVNEELRQTYAEQKIRIVDARVILVNKSDLDRHMQMADTIIRTLRIATDPEAKNAQITALTSNEFVADTSLREARQTENDLSPHGTRPRIDVGLTLRAKIRNEFGRELNEYNVDYQTLGMIGGYVEIGGLEEVMVQNVPQKRYRPIFHITACCSVIPLEGIASILLAAIAPTIYRTLHYATQWSNLADGNPNPGNLEADPARPDQALSLKNREELESFIRAYFTDPVIVWDLQDGRDNIPGMTRLVLQSNEAKRHFMQRLAHFFDVAEENVDNQMITRLLRTTYEGVIGDTSGELRDSREVDFLYLAARNGRGSIDRNQAQVLLYGAEDPVERARIVRDASGSSFIPLYTTTQGLINPSFIEWLARSVEARRMVIVDPNRQDEARPLGSFLDGFGSGQTIGSIVSSGTVNRGLGLGSIWS